jgi:hypothetical protein
MISNVVSTSTINPAVETPVKAEVPAAENTDVVVDPETGEVKFKSSYNFRLCNETALLCNLCALDDDLEFYNDAKNKVNAFELNTIAAFSDKIVKPVIGPIKKIENTNTTNKFSLWGLLPKYTIDYEVVCSYYLSSISTLKKQFRLVLVDNKPNTVVSIKKCELIVDDKVVETLDRTFMQIYKNDIKAQSLQCDQLAVPLPFFTERLDDTFLVQRSNQKVRIDVTLAVVSDDAFPYFELHCLVGTVPNKTIKELTDNPKRTYFETPNYLVPTKLVNSKLPTYQYNFGPEVLRLTGLYIVSPEPVKEYTLYYGETIVYRGYGNNYKRSYYMECIHKDGFWNRYLYYIPFSSPLSLKTETFKLRPYNPISRQNNATLDILCQNDTQQVQIIGVGPTWI